MLEVLTYFYDRLLKQKSVINHFSKMLLKCYLFAISKGNEDHRTERTRCSAIFGHEIFAETGIGSFIVVEKGKI